MIETTTGISRAIDPSEALDRFFDENQAFKARQVDARRQAALAKLSRTVPGTIWGLAHIRDFGSPYDEDDDPREFLTGIAHAVATRTHVQHRWAGGWKCWVCPMWSPVPLKSKCRSPREVSLSYVPGSLQPRTKWIRKWRGE